MDGRILGGYQESAFSFNENSEKLTGMRFLLAFVFVCAFGYSSAQVIHDESYRDTSFLRFKTELMFAIHNRDSSSLKLLMADTVEESRNGCGRCSREELVDFLFNNDPVSTWEEMAQVVRFGFAEVRTDDSATFFSENQVAFQAPSYHRKVMDEEEVLVLGENVNIRDRPNKKGKVIRQASFEKFKCDCNPYEDRIYSDEEGMLWLKIQLPTGEEGYVFAKLTSYHLPREMTVTKVRGEWKIISFFMPSGC